MLKEVRIIDEGFQYSSDKTLQPIASISPLIIIKNSNTIDSITVTDGGRGYTDATIYSNRKYRDWRKN